MPIASGCFLEAGHRIVDLARRYYEKDDESVLPRNIANKKAFENAMALDIAMGGSTNTVLHILAAAHEGEIDFTMDDIDRLSRRVPSSAKSLRRSPTSTWRMSTVPGGIMSILGELNRGGLLHADLPTVHSATMAEALARWGRDHLDRHCRPRVLPRSPRRRADPDGFSQNRRWTTSILTAKRVSSARSRRRSPRMAAWPCSRATSRSTAASTRPPALTRTS